MKERPVLTRRMSTKEHAFLNDLILSTSINHIKNVWRKNKCMHLTVPREASSVMITVDGGVMELIAQLHFLALGKKRDQM